MPTVPTTLGDSPLADLDGPLLATLWHERRLPLRHQRRLAKYLGPVNRALVHTVFAQVRRSRALACNPTAEVAVHTVLRHQDLDMYLVAIKSLLRFYSNVAVVVHDDGSLLAADVALIQTHVPGVQVIARATADARMRQVLAAHPACRAYRRRRVHAFQLFDYRWFGDTEKLLSLDSDVIFVRQPRQLLAWLRDQQRYIVFNQERGGTQIGRQLIQRGIPCHGTLNSGLLGFYGSAVDLDLVERYLRQLRGSPKWWFAQGYLDICLHRAGLEARPLDAQRYLVYMGQGGDQLSEVAMIHFIAYLRHAQFHYARLARAVIRDIGAK